MLCCCHTNHESADQQYYQEDGTDSVEEKKRAYHGAHIQDQKYQQNEDKPQRGSLVDQVAKPIWIPQFGQKLKWELQSPNFYVECDEVKLGLLIRVKNIGKEAQPPNDFG